MFLRRHLIRLLIAAPIGLGLGFAAARLVIGAPAPEEVVAGFIEETGIPGGVLVTREPDGRMSTVTFGDARPAEALPIASLTKPITAAAIHDLIANGRLALDEPAWPLLDLPPPADPRWRQITIRQLLQHRAGFDRGIVGDPIYNPAHFPCRDVAERMVKAPLQFDPGARFAYSNFGYCLLGLIIERVTRMPYAEHVRSRFIRPLGLASFNLGPYDPASMGWIATPAELAALLASLDLTPIAGPPPADAGESYFGLGWQIWPMHQAFTHVGNGSATFAFVARKPDGRLMLLLCRGRVRDAQATADALARALMSAGTL